MTVYTVFYKRRCPFSQTAIQRLRHIVADEKRQLHLIEVNEENLNLVAVLNKNGIYDHRTVPAIFENDRFIGGDAELQKELSVLRRR